MLLSAQLEKCCDPILLCSETGSIDWCNQAGQRMFGIAPGDRLSAILPSELAGELLGLKHFSTQSVQVSTSAGLQITQSVFSTLIGSDDPGTDSHLLVFKSCALENRHCRSEELGASVTHDLKNPLGAIFGYADALLDTALGSSLSKAQQQIISKIRNTAARAIELVRNCELLFHLGCDEPRTRSKIDFNEAVKQVVDYTWREDPKNPVLTVDLCRENLLVRAERLQLDRIIGNLFSNALKYTPHAGTVAIRTRLNGHEAVLEVYNSGPAIAPDELPCLFEKYRRASTSAGIPGSGLGLYITKTLVDLLQGSIEVSSSEKEGTCFRVFLPCSS